VDNAATRPGSWRLGRLLAIGLIALTPLACGKGGPELAKVTGKVTYNGKPVTKGTITFVTIDKTGRNATGAIQPDGSYTLQTEEPGDGAQLGDYNVTIAARDEEILDYTPPKPIPPKRLVPEKYEKPQTSGLTKKVVSGSNSFNFDLVD
jgi:hypothetical protein